jgi:hypothetical protein
LPFTFDRDSVATRVNKQGLIETVGADQPRIDYLNDSNGALLLEPSRTNSVTKSENIQDWNRASNATSEFGYEDPFKGNNAVKLTSSSTAQSYQVYQSTTALSSGTTYTFSMYAKKGTGHIFRLDFGIPDNGFVHIDLRDGSLLQESGSTYYDGYSVTPISNGWYRISMTATFNSSAYYRAGLFNQQGDCYVAFAQIEEGSYATSYIPTQGSAVTRVADDMPNNLNINPLNIGNSYTLFLDADLNNFENNRVFCEIENSASNGVFTIRNTIGQIRVYNNLDAQYPTSNLQSNTNRWAIRIDGNSYKIFGADNSLSGTLPTARNIGEIKFYGSLTELKINNFNIYNTALSDAECEALVN